MEEKLPTHREVDQLLYPILDKLIKHLISNYEISPRLALVSLRNSGIRWETETSKFLEIAEIYKLLPGVDLDQAVALYNSKLVSSVLVEKIVEVNQKPPRIRGRLENICDLIKDLD
jgi:hypothetical protein